MTFPAAIRTGIRIYFLTIEHAHLIGSPAGAADPVKFVCGIGRKHIGSQCTIPIPVPILGQLRILFLKAVFDGAVDILS